jgi:hypothetical protein
MWPLDYFYPPGAILATAATYYPDQAIIIPTTRKRIQSQINTNKDGQIKHQILTLVPCCIRKHSNVVI